MLSINRPKSSKFASTKGNITRVQETIGVVHPLGATSVRIVGKLMEQSMSLE